MLTTYYVSNIFQANLNKKKQQQPGFGKKFTTSKEVYVVVLILCDLNILA